MSCKDIVPFSIWDIAAGKDVINQGRGGAVKDSDGNLWIPTNLTPMGAALQGMVIRYVRNGKLCDK